MMGTHDFRHLSESKAKPTARRQCSTCASELGFTEGDPCDNCVTVKPTALLPGQTVIKCEKCGIEISRYDSLQGWCLICASKLIADTRAQSPAQAEWLPIESASKDEYGLFWLDWAVDVAPLNPPLSETVWGRQRIFMGKRGCWPSTFRATHWMPLPQPPKEQQ